MKQHAFVCGLSGPVLTADEKDFLGESCPVGIIIFARNVESPYQLARLVSEAREAVGGEEQFLVLVDQEGGRVQRLTAPHWRKYPAAEAFSKAYIGESDRAARCAFMCAQLMAVDLHMLGINTCCAPVLDIPVAGADRVIGDRAYGDDAATVIRLGDAVAEGLLRGGVLPVLKHIPGHGRAETDSHFALPVVHASLEALEATDFQPFKALRHHSMAMTAHVVLTAVDSNAPVTVSREAIQKIIRGAIGFDGLLMSDDISMRALSGSIANRAKGAIEAGCDIVLHCNGTLSEMEDVAASVPVLEGNGSARLDAAFQQLKPPEIFDRAEAEEALSLLLAARA